MLVPLTYYDVKYKVPNALKDFIKDQEEYDIAKTREIFYSGPKSL